MTLLFLLALLHPATALMAAPAPAEIPVGAIAVFRMATNEHLEINGRVYPTLGYRTYVLFPGPTSFLLLYVNPVRSIAAAWVRVEPSGLSIKAYKDIERYNRALLNRATAPADPLPLKQAAMLRVVVGECDSSGVFCRD